eukprot:13857145-Alexandrium_andersonii.AAC.1
MRTPLKAGAATKLDGAATVTDALGFFQGFMASQSETRGASASSAAGAGASDVAAAAAETAPSP